MSSSSLSTFSSFSSSTGGTSNKARESLNGEHQEHLNNGKDHSNCNAILCSEEEEAAFLRSLGWEEHARDDGGLTEEEINSWVDKVSISCKY